MAKRITAGPACTLRSSIKSLPMVRGGQSRLGDSEICQAVTGGPSGVRWLAGQIPENSPIFCGCFNGFSIATLPRWAWYWLNLTDMRVVKHLIWVPHFDPYPAALATGSSDPGDFYPQQLLDRGTGIYQKY